MTKFSTRDSYFYPGTTVLRNKRDIQDAGKLRSFEEQITLAELSSLLTQDPIEGSFDRAHMKALHQRIFQRVYEWAGQERGAPVDNQMSKSGPSPESISEGNYLADDQYPYFYYPANTDMIPHFDRQIRYLHAYGDLAGSTPSEFAEMLAEPWEK